MKKLMCLLILLLLVCGCTNWKRRYERLEAKHAILERQIEREQGRKGLLAQAIVFGQQRIDLLQWRINHLKQSPAEATGFGEGYDVAFDPEAGTVTVTLPEAILFAPGKAALQSSANSRLDHIVSVINSEYAGLQIEVVGHTDSDPIRRSPWKDNWELSAQRALAVTRYLIGKGMAENKIRASGRGESVPRASNATANGKAQNRRVEIIVELFGD